MSDAIVYMDRQLKRKVLIKSLKPDTEQSRLLDELAALQAIRSKHVVQIYDVVRTDEGNVEAIVEEYLEGQDLTTIPRPTSARDFYKAIFPIAQGIADIHAHDVVHRDIKPQNMKFDSEGYVKVFDFGLSRTRDGQLSTLSGIGTLGFMAPELFKPGSSGRIEFSKAIDTYAFGATALLICFGRFPGKMLQVPPVAPRKGDAFGKCEFALPEEVVGTLNDCLAVDPGKRPTMKEVVNLLGLHLLRGQHRALLVASGKTYVVDAQNSAVSLSVADQGSLKLQYDGLRFRVHDVQGAVAINNVPATEGSELPEACVIVLGEGVTRSKRTMITVDVSNPEVGI